MEPPLCSSPHHLSGLTVARLRLAQLVSFEKRRELRYLTTPMEGLPPHTGSVESECDVGIADLQRLPWLWYSLWPSGQGHHRNHEHHHYQRLSWPKPPSYFMLLGRVAELINFRGRLEHIPPPFLIRWLGVVHLLIWRQNQERWRYTPTTHWREPRPRY